MFTNDSEETGLAFVTTSNGWTVEGYCKRIFIESKTQKTKKGKPVKFPVYFKRVVLNNRNGMEIKFPITKRKGTYSISDSRQKDKSCALDLTERGYNPESFVKELSRMIEPEVASKLVWGLLEYVPEPPKGKWEDENEVSPAVIGLEGIAGKVFVEVQLFSNYAKNGKTAEALLNDDMEASGFEAPTIRRNDTPAKFEGDKMVSPQCAWSGTVTFLDVDSESALEAIVKPLIGRSKIKKDGNAFIVYSNDLCRKLLAKQETPSILNNDANIESVCMVS